MKNRTNSLFRILKVILRFGNWRFEYCGHDHFPNVRVYETDGMIGISTVAL